MWEREKVGSSRWWWWWWKKGRAKLWQSFHRNELSPPANLMMVMRMLMGWLRSRRRRFIFLVICSPFLLPLLCLAFPLFCFAELCLRFYRWRHRGDKKGCNDQCEEEDGGCGLCRCEEGRGGEPIEVREGRLLQRYLEDQLGLVGSVYDCGDEGFGDCEEEEDDDLGEKTSPLLQ
ncbi:uncharacterized protein LOC122067125 [Macadamia integrifolia]|uniref:uncharacterized protein LOC122067125 n=1 Tax=Macadamia integrifolia TaxID=60698 RepID=UPI001C5013D0|nr:uncharacterized protein LOC122067125 [Macadamia integrifolia]